jgi:hypothetical protein
MVGGNLDHLASGCGMIYAPLLAIAIEEAIALF